MSEIFQLLEESDFADEGDGDSVVRQRDADFLQGDKGVVPRIVRFVYGAVRAISDEGNFLVVGGATLSGGHESGGGRRSAYLNVRVEERIHMSGHVGRGSGGLVAALLGHDYDKGSSDGMNEGEGDAECESERGVL